MHCKSRIANVVVSLLSLVAAIAFSLPVHAIEKESLPWESDYETALAKAKRTKRPLFVMMTATWCGPCKKLESESLPHRDVLEGLEEFVWVQAFEDKTVEQKYGCNGYPTLAFIDPQEEKVLHKHTGYQPAGPFLKTVIDVRKAASLPLNDRLVELSEKVFNPDWKILNELINAGDGAGIKKYLAPVKDDELRSTNFVVGKVEVPGDIDTKDVITGGAIGDRTIPKSGIFIASVPRDRKDLVMQVHAPQCKVVNQKIIFAKKEAVAFQKVSLKPLIKKDAVRFSGTVMLPNGKPAKNAIVRICDWDVVKADKAGKFKFDMVSPGKFTVRAEYPGGEFHQEIEFEGPKPMKKDLMLKPVATVGIRWAIQTNGESKELVGSDMKEGEAFFSIAHSRFSLSRGAEVRNHSGSDFMLVGNEKRYTQNLPPKQQENLQSAGEKAPLFWLFDATSRPTGLHLESEPFDSLRSVDEKAFSNPREFFVFLRGMMVEKGQVFTVRCVHDDLYAKLEIVDVSEPVK